MCWVTRTFDIFNGVERDLYSAAMVSELNRPPARPITRRFP